MPDDAPRSGPGTEEAERAPRLPPLTTLPEESVAATFETLATAFDEARARHPRQVHVRHFVFADRGVRVTFVGDRLAERITRPLAHLAIREPAGDPELAIDLWDEAETGVAFPGRVVGPEPAAPAAVGASADGRYAVHQRARMWTAFDRRDRRIVGWYADGRELTLYEAGRPLHPELLLWHRDRDLHAVHAGLVSRDGDGVILGGPGGSGKSTVALCCLDAGWAYMADDYVALEEHPEGFTGHSLYCSIHLEPDHLRHFPRLMPHAVPGRFPGEDKHMVLLSELYDQGLTRATRIRAVALPRVVPGLAAPRVRPASRAEAILRIAPSSLFMLPHAGGGPGGFERISALVRRAPPFWLELGSELDTIPERVGDILAEGLKS